MPRQPRDLLVIALASGPAKGTMWRHCKGGLYVVVCVALEERKLNPVVIYQAIEDGVTWTRPLAEWRENVKYKGKTVARFVPAG